MPKSGSTSTLFIQDALGKKNLRLDYGYNVKTQTVNYHWNQKGTYQIFGIADHTPVGTAGRMVYKSARYFRYAGRALAVVGVALDVYSVVVADKPLRQATKVAAGWAGARGGGQGGGGGGGPGGPPRPPRAGAAIRARAPVVARGGHLARGGAPPGATG